MQQTCASTAALVVGQVSETVEVTSETPLLQTDTSSLGTVVNQREANELPLNGRNIYNLTTITPSVVPQGNTMGTVVGKNPFDFANYQIGGAFANEGAIYLDGQPLNIGYINLPLMVPTQDAVSEFKVQYSNLGPEWGKFAGGVINLSTKSGTNTWHGSGYDYLRNKIFNSNEFFNKNSEIAPGKSNEPPPFTQNQFGATIGGAVDQGPDFCVLQLRRIPACAPALRLTPPCRRVAERGGRFLGSLYLRLQRRRSFAHDNRRNFAPALQPALSDDAGASLRTPIPFNCLRPRLCRQRQVGNSSIPHPRSC